MNAVTETKADLGNVHQRLAAVMREVTYIRKESKQGMKYTIVSHDSVTAKVRPALLKCGIVYYPIRCDHTHNGNRAECSMTVRFANIDKPEDCIDVQTFGYGVDPQDKGPGKAMSYAVKYALLKALGLETGDDADHDSIEHDQQDPHAPDPVDLLVRHVNAAKTLEELRDVWTANATKKAAADPRSIKAKDERKAVLQSNPPITDDEIPY